MYYNPGIEKLHEETFHLIIVNKSCGHALLKDFLYRSFKAIFENFHFPLHFPGSSPQDFFIDKSNHIPNTDLMFVIIQQALDVDSIKRLVDSTRPQLGDPALHLALTEAKRTFDDETVRPDARKVYARLFDDNYYLLLLLLSLRL